MTCYGSFWLNMGHFGSFRVLVQPLFKLYFRILVRLVRKQI